MAARGMAQDVVKWYLDNLDPFLPHPKNIQNLRGPVVGLTTSIIQSKVQDDVVVDDEATTPSSPSGRKSPVPLPSDDKWKKFMIHDSESEKLAYETLARRPKARMEAFLSSLSFAVPVDAVEKKSDKGSGETTPRASQTTGQSTESTRSITTTPRSSRKGGSPLSSPVLASVRNTINTKTLLKQISKTDFRQRRYRQIAEEELLTRLELYIRSLHRARSSGDECVVAVEPPRAIRARANSIVLDFVNSVGCVRDSAPLLTKLVTYLTKELLAVDTLGEDLVKVIRRIVSEYQHSTSFASLAFLSSPEVSADSVLTPLILKYVKYLQSDWKNLVSSCELERILSNAVNPNLRRLFKTIEFQSIGHLLETCQNYRHELRDIQLAPELFLQDEQGMNTKKSKDALTQALRDLQREVITVNGHVLPPATSRHELVHLLSQTLNSKTLTVMPPSKKKKRSSKSAAAAAAAANTAEGGSSVPRVESSPSIADSTVSESGYDEDCESDRPNRRRSIFHLSTIDMLTKRLLLAASRTGTGGDAFFVVRDLFGGDDVEVVPSKSLPTYAGMVRSGSIDISVRLASLTIKCHGSFDVYPKSLVGCCEPLIQVHTTISETIHLHEVRASDSEDGEDGTPQHKDDNNDNDGNWSDDEGRRKVSSMVVQERITPRTGWRTLSIRPALYEKVQDWDTPS